MSNSPTTPATGQAETPPEEFEPKILTFPIVGIGASAGGLDAFQQLLGALSAQTGMAFVLIQHLDRIHKSLLTELLARFTAMVVVEVADGLSVEPNCVYVIPPNTELRIADGKLHLSPRPMQAGPHLPIDVFFDSLAAEQGRLAFGIILSGTGADGVEGIKAIKTRCGITFAQDEGSAAYPAMPRSAVATGLVDYVLTPVQMAAELERISRHPYVVAPDGNGADLLAAGSKEVNEIYTLLRRSRNVDFSHYRQTTLHRRLGRRMVVQQSKDLRHYLDYVRKHPEELDELYRDLLIHVTSFFRDPEAFSALREQILRLVKSGQIGDSLRVWVPGCSTGEEVYSIAITAREICEDAEIRPEIQIFGTDISEQALRVARSGFFGEAALRGVPAAQLVRHFKKVDGQYQINKAIRDTCIFAWQDVTNGIPFSRLHLISCRNMLIYVEPALQKTVISVFHYALNPAGLLLLGSAESTAAAPDLFTTIDARNKIFARKPGPARITQRFTAQRGAHDAATPLQAGHPSGGMDLQREVDRAIRRRYSPDCVVVNRAWQIVEFRGHTGAYLENPAGAATADLMRMVKDDLRFALRDALARAIEHNIFVEKAGIRMADGSGSAEVALEVTPLAGSEEEEDRLYLVVFKAATAIGFPASATPVEVATGAEKGIASRAEADLADARTYIRTMSEEHASALEELRASNEELQSSNEELQSISEEQETTKEELQSTNEELNTVNDEMKERNHQLGELSDDLTNLLGAANIPMFRVDRKLQLCRFTPAAEKPFGVGVGDLRQPIRLLQNRLGSAVDLEKLIQEVMSSLAMQTRDIQDAAGHWWSLAIRPYRTADDRLDGAVLTFGDIHAIHEALQISQQAQGYAESIVQTVREPLVILTPDLRIDSANAAFLTMFRLDARRISGQFFYEVAEHIWDIAKLRSLLRRLSHSAESFADFEMTVALPETGQRTLILNGRRLEFDSKTRILLALEDATERKRSEQSVHHELEKTDEELDRTRSELRALTSRLMTAQEEEQRRIAHELHDDLAQRLGFLEFQVEKWRLGAVSRAHGEVAELLAGLQAQIAELSGVIRNISHGLHPAVIEDLGLVAALRKLVGGYAARPQGSARFVSRVGDCSFPKEHFSSSIYRIAQEALHNVAKHAASSDIVVTLTCKAKEMLLTIRDNGPGFDPRSVRGKGGVGIVNMEERARLLGALFEVRSARGQGTKIGLRVPLPDIESSKKRRRRQ